MNLYYLNNTLKLITKDKPLTQRTQLSKGHTYCIYACDGWFMTLTNSKESLLYIQESVFLKKHLELNHKKHTLN